MRSYDQFIYDNKKATQKDQKDRVYTSNAILCTIPPNLLKSESIQFNPSLSSYKKNSIYHLEIGYHNQVILKFEKSF